MNVFSTLTGTSTQQRVMCFFPNFWSMLTFYTPWKHQKNKGFLVFSEGIKRQHWPEMGSLHEENASSGWPQILHEENASSG